MNHYLSPRRPACLAIALAVFLWSAAAAASAAILEEVIVTAQKREQSLQDIPIAVTAFEAERIREQDFRSLLDVQGHVPGVQVSNFSVGQPEIAIRGVSTKEDGPAANDSTVVLVDGVYIAARTAQVFDIYDLERIEVSRGPQGTLFGRNSSGGTINLVTMKPSEDFKVRLEQTFAKFDRYDTRGLINGRLAENVFAKASFSRRTADGYTDSVMTGVADAHDADSIYGRAQVLWQASDRTEVLFTVDAGYDDLGPTNREPVAGDLPRPARDGPNNFNPIAVNSALGGLDEFDSLAETEGFMEREIYGVSAKITHDFDTMRLVSITALRRSEFDWIEDSSGLPPASGPPLGPPNDGFFLDINDEAVEDASQFTQEFRLQSIDPAFERVNWLAGLFFTAERNDRTETFDFTSGVNSRFQSIQKNTTIAWALYGEATIDITDRLRLTAGGRFSFEEKSFTAAGEPERGNPVIIQPFTAVNADETWTSFDSRFALSYDLTDEILVYGSVSEAFKSGGFTGAPSTAERATTPFDPEDVTNYEIGMKSRLFDQRVQLNLTAFWTELEDLQVTEFFQPVGNPFGQFITQNAGEARSRGVEGELVALPFAGTAGLEDLEIGATGAWLDAEFVDFSPEVPRDGDGDPATVDPFIPAFDDNRLRQSPEWSASVWTRYGRSFPWGDIALRVDGRFQADIFFDPDNNKNAFTPAYQVWDSRLAYTTPGGRIEVAAWAKNMFDEEYRTHVFSQSGGNIAFALFGAPRTYGLTITLSYE